MLINDPRFRLLAHNINKQFVCKKEFENIIELTLLAVYKNIPASQVAIPHQRRSKI